MAKHLINSRWTDLFVRRPVLAVTLATVVVVLGAFGIGKMTVREYPKLTTTVITVGTSYPGASPQTVQSYITQPLSRVLGSVPHLDYMTSSSSQGISTITLYMKLNANSEEALTNTLTQIKQVESLLPKNSFPPVVNSSSGSRTALMYIAFSSPGEQMTIPQIVDYVVRNAQPLLQTVPGVSQAQVVPVGASGGNGNNQAVRVWLNPREMAARSITPADVERALGSQNVVAATGKTEGNLISVPLTSNMEMTSVGEFRNLVVKTVNGTPIYLRDVAKVEIGAESYISKFYFDGEPAVAIGIQTTPSANDLSVALGIHRKIQELEQRLPPGMKVGLPYNGANFIHTAIDEVATTIAITLGVVVLVIFLFLGSLRALVVPLVAIPLSLVGAGFFMYMAGYSLNLLTLLAFVLAIGLVVDDAIVMVENVHRHVDEGRSGFQAAVISARELTLPIIVMSTTLIAVYLPVAFGGGLTGALFTEFAMTIVFAVMLSMVIALTLSPMLSGRILRSTPSHGLNHFLETSFQRFRALFDRSLHGFLEFPVVGAVFIVATFVALYFLFTGVRHELSPPQNSGVVFSLGTAPPNAAPKYVNALGKEVLGTFDRIPEKDHTFMVTGFSPTGGGNNSLIGGMTLKPFGERTRTATELKPKIQKDLGAVAGLKAAAFTPPPLPGSAGLFPIDFVITSSRPYADLDHIANAVLAKARESHRFLFLQKDLKIDQPQYKLVVNRKLAGRSRYHHGPDRRRSAAHAVGRPMSTSSPWTAMPTRSFPRRRTRSAPTPRIWSSTISSASDGTLVPLSTLVSFKTDVFRRICPSSIASTA